MHLQTILSIVLSTTAIRKELILSPTRKEEVVTARFLFFYLAKKHTLHNAIEISRFLNRDHKLFYHAINQVDKWKQCDKNFRALYETLNNQLSLLK